MLGRLDVDLDVQAPASTLTLAQQQTVEIAKAFSLNVRVLIMDEPTASLRPRSRQLFEIVSRLQAEGVAILFISHRLEEVFEEADRITIMRDGAWTSSTTTRAEMTIDEAIHQMVGREVVEFYRRTESNPGEGDLQVEGLGVEGAFEGITSTCGG